MKEVYKKPIVIRKIRDDVWQKFRKLCAKHDISANKGVIRLITNYVERAECGEEVICNCKK